MYLQEAHNHNHPTPLIIFLLPLLLRQFWEVKVDRYHHHIALPLLGEEPPPLFSTSRAEGRIDFEHHTDGWQKSEETSLFNFRAGEIYEQCGRWSCSTPLPSSLSVFISPGVGVLGTMVVVSVCYNIVQGAVGAGLSTCVWVVRVWHMRIETALKCQETKGRERGRRAGPWELKQFSCARKWREEREESWAVRIKTVLTAQERREEREVRAWHMRIETALKCQETKGRERWEALL